MAAGPQRVHVAAAPVEQQIRELDERDAARLSSAYTRLYTPNGSTSRSTQLLVGAQQQQRPSGTTITSNNSNNSAVLQPVSSTSPLHHNVAILDDSDDDDNENDCDNENDDDLNADSAAVGTGRHKQQQQQQQLLTGRVRVESTASTAHLQSTSASPARLNPRLSLHALTNRFDDERLEESYQLYSSDCDFPVGRRIVLFLVAFELSAYVLFLYRKHECPASTASTTGCYSYDVGTHELPGTYTVLLWLFAPLATLYALLPMALLEQYVGLRFGVYFLRRRWKELGATIILLWSIGLAIVLSATLAAMREQFQRDVFVQSTCGRNVTVPLSWYSASNWATVNEQLFHDHGMNLREWVFIYDSKVAYSVIVAALAAFAALVGILSIAMKLDFVHVLAISLAQSIATLVLVVTGPSMSLNSDIRHKVSNQTLLFVLCIVIPAVVTLLATYSEDRAARSAFVSKRHAERINTTLKLDLSVKRNGLENQHQVGAEAKAAIAAALGDASAAMAVCQSVAIPFSDLSLNAVLSKSPTGDVLRADYYGTAVVFKRLAVSALTPQGLDDFKLRVELLASLRHPNIIQFIGATFDDVANVGVVLEFLEQGDVLALLRSAVALTWSDPLLKIATAVAQGLTYLHNCEPPLVHRDVKSTNLLCTPTFSCKISDFGESKRETSLLNSVVGTPYWVAPEIIREERYDHQIDVYSFGIVLIELETRKLPYHDLRDYAAADIMQLVAFGNLRPTIPATCSPFRRQLITRCLDADPLRRPRMAEVLSVLQHEVRQELLEQNSFDSTRDKRRLLLMQRHQRLNRKGLQALLQDSSDSP